MTSIPNRHGAPAFAAEPTARRGIVRRTPTRAHAPLKLLRCVVERTPSGRIRRKDGIDGPCPGYVVDHIVLLKRGGSDSPDNMQWQTREEAKAKGRIE